MNVCFKTLKGKNNVQNSSSTNIIAMHRTSIYTYLFYVLFCARNLINSA